MADRTSHLARPAGQAGCAKCGLVVALAGCLPGPCTNSCGLDGWLLARDQCQISIHTYHLPLPQLLHLV